MYFSVNLQVMLKRVQDPAFLREVFEKGNPKAPQNFNTVHQGVNSDYDLHRRG